MKDLLAVDVDGQQHKILEDELQWRPGVYGIVIENGKILLSPQYGDAYALPGGGMRLAETFEQAVKREVKEETGIDVSVGKLVTVRQNLFVWKPDEPDHRHALNSIMLYFICTKIGGERSTDGFEEEEKQYVRQAEWIDLAKLDSLKPAGSMDFRDIVRQVIG